METYNFIKEHVFQSFMYSRILNVQVRQQLVWKTKWMKKLKMNVYIV